MGKRLNEFLRDERGMTLTELMAAMAVGTILMLFIIQTYAFTGNIFEKTAATDDLGRTTQAVVDFLEDRISCAESLEICTVEMSENENTHEILFSEEGRIYYDGEAVYGEEFYRKRKVFCQILPLSDGEEAPVLKYRITWKNQKNKTLYSAGSVVKLLNLELDGEEIGRNDGDTGADQAGRALYFYYTERYGLRLEK